MLDYAQNKSPRMKLISGQSDYQSNNLLIDNKYTPLSKHNSKLLDFIKQKNRFIIKNSFDIKETREFLASKEVAMRVIKLNDEIVEEDKRNEFDSDYKDIYSSNVNYNLDNIKNRVGKKISTTNMKKKFSSNKEIFDMNMKKFKKELKTIKEGIYSNKEDKSKKKKNKKSKKAKDSSEQKNHKESTIVKAKENNLQLQSISNAENSIGLNKNKHIQSQFLFSEIHKKLMIDDDLNISEIIDQEKSPKIRHKSKLMDQIFPSFVNNNSKIYKTKIKNKSCKNIYEEKKSNNKEKQNIHINSDKESLLSILSDLI